MMTKGEWSCGEEEQGFVNKLWGKPSIASNVPLLLRDSSLRTLELLNFIFSLDLPSLLSTTHTSFGKLRSRHNMGTSMIP